jgi:hypothetical protein
MYRIDHISFSNRSIYSCLTNHVSYKKRIAIAFSLTLQDPKMKTMAYILPVYGCCEGCEESTCMLMTHNPITIIISSNRQFFLIILRVQLVFG